MKSTVRACSSRSRQHHIPGGTLKQPCAKVSLQLGDPVGDGRLGQANMLRGPREAGKLRHAYEGLKGGQLIFMAPPAYEFYT